MNMTPEEERIFWIFFGYDDTVDDVNGVML